MAIAGKMSKIVSILSCLAMLQVSYAAVYKVGGSSGWTVPKTNTLYSAWATKQTFKVGDVLEFDFQTGAHTVAEVSKADYDSCNLNNPIKEEKTGPANMTLTSGAHYYICTIPTHCNSGQKLAVTTAANGSGSSPAGAPTATSPAGSVTPTSGSPSGSPGTTSADTPAGSTGASGPSANSANVVVGSGFALGLASLVAAAFLY